METKNIAKSAKSLLKDIDASVTTNTEAMTFEMVFITRQDDDGDMLFMDKDENQVSIPLSKLDNFEGLNVSPIQSEKVEVAIVTGTEDGQTLYITGKNEQIKLEKIKRPIEVGIAPNHSRVYLCSTNSNCVPATFCGMSVMVDRYTGQLCYFIV